MVHMDHQHAIEAVGRQLGIGGFAEPDADIVEPLARDAFGERIADLRHDVFGEHAPLGADTVREADGVIARSEEHTSELQSLMRLSYAVFCLEKKKKTNN